MRKPRPRPAVASAAQHIVVPGPRLPPGPGRIVPLRRISIVLVAVSSSRTAPLHFCRNPRGCSGGLSGAAVSDGRFPSFVGVGGRSQTGLNGTRRAWKTVGNRVGRPPVSIL